MAAIRSVAVFCGSRVGNQPAYRAAAEALGTGLAASNIRLIYGGGRIGLMGVLADAALAAGGEVIGVIPEFLTRREVAHGSLHSLVVSDSMHARKQRMYELSDAFVALPGGLGTYDETMEVITWRQLGLHDKPILLCDVAGSAAPIVAAMETAIAWGFAAPSTRDLFAVADGAPGTLAALQQMSAGEGAWAGRL